MVTEGVVAVIVDSAGEILNGSMGPFQVRVLVPSMMVNVGAVDVLSVPEFGTI